MCREVGQINRSNFGGQNVVNSVPEGLLINVQALNMIRSLPVAGGVQMVTTQPQYVQQPLPVAYAGPVATQYTPQQPSYSTTTPGDVSE